MRWRLILEEFGPNLQYIKGTLNVVADALSRLEVSENDLHVYDYPEQYGAEDDEISPHAYPLCFKQIAKAQN